MNQSLSSDPQITSSEGLRLVPGIAPLRYPPIRTTPGTPTLVTMHRAVVRGVAARTKYGRGAHIGRPTHLASTLVASFRYDRGL